MYPSMFYNSSKLLGEYVVGENYVKFMKYEVVRLGNILEFFTECDETSLNSNFNDFLNDFSSITLVSGK